MMKIMENKNMTGIIKNIRMKRNCPNKIGKMMVKIGMMMVEIGMMMVKIGMMIVRIIMMLIIMKIRRVEIMET
jgi:hypothetical protein